MPIYSIVRIHLSFCSVFNIMLRILPFYQKQNVWAQGTIQKKSASGTRTLPYLVIFLRNFILIWKCQKGSLKRGTLVSATAIYQTNCPFTVLSALFLFFWTLPYDSKLFTRAFINLLGVTMGAVAKVRNLAVNKWICRKILCLFSRCFIYLFTVISLISSFLKQLYWLDGQ